MGKGTPVVGQYILSEKLNLKLETVDTADIASAAVTSAELASNLVLTTPNIGIATGTSFNAITGLATVVSPMDGIAAVGTGTTVARADHIHASDTTKVNASLLGAANGVATLGADSKIPAGQLPSYVDDVLEYVNLAGFPITGETGKIYIALDDSKAYRWTGTIYFKIASGSVDSVAGKTGIVTLTAADVGLGNVSNVAQVTSVTASGALSSSGGITPAITHSTDDGNLHVPATGTTNSGKVLTAGATAGSLSWETPVAGSVSVITAPSITSPATGATNFMSAIVSSAYAAGDTFAGTHDYTQWQLSYTADFAIIRQESTAGNLTSWTPTVGLALQQCYVRVRHGSDNHRSGWSTAISFTTPNIFINTPTMTVTGTPTDVPETPTLTTSAFSVANGSDTHASTDWQVVRVSDSVVVWQSLASTANKLTITVPVGVLAVSTAYTFKARHNGTTYGSSAYVSVSGTTKSAFTIPIGTAGAMDFGVAPSSEAWAVMGLSEMTGTTTAGHDNYGNYQHTNSSIMVHVPKFYYRIGNASAAQFATYGANSIEIRGTESYASEATANAAGFVLHRAFIDGGAEKGGFFIDKYMASKKVGELTTAVSVKNGNPIGLTTSTVYTTPSSTMTGCTGILADAVTLCRARGSYFNAASAFMYGAIAMLSIAHGQRATSTAACGWYNAGLTTNFPKGCNNNALADVNDTSVTWTANGVNAVCGLTGSASTFNKSTHNGQNNGIADVNGLMYEVGLGVTNIGTSATDTVTIATSTIYTLKTTVALKSLTAGWDGANDAWGNTTSLLTKYNAVTSSVALTTAGWVYWGNSTNAVFDSAASGVGRDLCGILPKNDTAHSTTGTNMCGNDGAYCINKANMQPLFCGNWSSAATAGVLCRNLGSYRSDDGSYAGFRASAYV